MHFCVANEIEKKIFTTFQAKELTKNAFLRKKKNQTFFKEHMKTTNANAYFFAFLSLFTFHLQYLHNVLHLNSRRTPILHAAAVSESGTLLTSR